MSRPAAAVNPGQTNRKFIMLAVSLGLIGAILVYVAFSRQSSGTGGGASDLAVVVANQDIPARTRITQSMVDVKLVSSDTRSTLGYTDLNDVIGKVTRFPVAANEQVLSSKVVGLDAANGDVVSRSLSFIVPPGHRGIAFKVEQVTNAGGLALPGDYVDVIVVYDVDFPSNPADATSRQKVTSYFAQTLLQNIEVLAVSQTVVDIVPDSTPTAGGQRVRNTEAKADPGAITVTLALTPEEAQKMYLADSNGRIRLSVRPFGDASVPPLSPINQTDIIPSNLPNPFFQR